ncbi:hypothetical protein AMJ44_03740 [candidate division WOR-1 bacterium DG_54_3]|uniref:Alpha-1,4-glucan:maltose-1-phosphate maltosyltransferase n=1 Tax=candidate division WOR-1 bacterium DG_54_3 TaxID=1703775 RepID=A0A0S7Y427_UNCSA|nr:MAG: hypothetical protein AMJ44_03740 [candidate division WOR-1 bacterium DG_54_3]
MNNRGRIRVVIENVRPEINGGRFPIKRVVGEEVVVQADVFCDGHDQVAASLLYRPAQEMKWREVPMKFLVNDRWEAAFAIEEMSDYLYTVQGWVDHFHTWRSDLQKKFEAGQDVKVELLMGVELINGVAERASEEDAKKLKGFARNISKEKKQAKAVALSWEEELAALMRIDPDKSRIAVYEIELKVVVDRERALFGSWYEMFPRSCSPDPKRSGTFEDCKAYLPELAKMGFDVLYLPPIHPIGKTNRKGKNNTPLPRPEDPGSPWAIGNKQGGHKAIDPSLGTLKDFENLLSEAQKHNIEIALDLSFQSSPDHPYVKDHPEWYRKRPDGTIQYAENPPKKYEDIIPFNFETENWKELWEELKSIVIFWIDKGVRIFRVDNPHTKPFPFWEWLIGEVKKDHPEVILLSEAFTRPKVMYRLAKVGFNQSYTYFTWRNTKWELTEYLTELTRSEVCEFFRPNFFTNTPDILPEFLQHGGQPAFVIRLVLAATMSASYGVFGPVFERCLGEALPGTEEYKDSEKYEIKHWDWKEPTALKALMTRINKIRRENPALQTTWNIKFHEVDNDYLLFYSKTTEDLSNIIWVVVNLDPHHTQSGWVKVPLQELGIDASQSYLVQDLISGNEYIWQGEKNYVELNPAVMPAHVLLLHRQHRRESDFDYYM